MVEPIVGIGRGMESFQGFGADWISPPSDVETWSEGFELGANMALPFGWGLGLLVVSRECENEPRGPKEATRDGL